MNKIEPDQRSMPEINPDKVCFVIAKARELFSEDEDVEADASNPEDDGERSILTEEADAPIREELMQFIGDLDEDEQCALLALVWIGRGDYEPQDWQSAVDFAQERREERAARRLLEIPLLPDYLEEALDAYGCSCEDFDASA